jgi:hypothetical protein
MSIAIAFIDFEAYFNIYKLAFFVPLIPCLILFQILSIKKDGISSLSYLLDEKYNKE